jgi:hypothetical protein
MICFTYPGNKNPGVSGLDSVGAWNPTMTFGTQSCSKFNRLFMTNEIVLPHALCSQARIEAQCRNSHVMVCDKDVVRHMWHVKRTYADRPVSSRPMILTLKGSISAELVHNTCNFMSSWHYKQTDRQATPQTAHIRTAATLNSPSLTSKQRRKQLFHKGKTF